MIKKGGAKFCPSFFFSYICGLGKGDERELKGSSRGVQGTNVMLMFT